MVIVGQIRQKEIERDRGRGKEGWRERDCQRQTRRERQIDREAGIWVHSGDFRCPPAAVRQAWRMLLCLALLVVAVCGVGGQYCPAGAATACTSVLVVCADYPAYCADVFVSLNATAAFTTVETFHASSVADGGAGATPTAAQLAAHHAVLVFSDNAFGDAALLGDRLAAYHDQGGGVVVAMLANYAGNRVQGAYGTPSRGYALLDYAQRSVSNPSDSLGDVLEPQSPLMAGVASLNATMAFRSTAPVISGRGVVVARWRNGGREPLVVRGTKGSRTLVELNLWPVSRSGYSGGWTGDGALLLRNALKYSRCMPCGPGTFAAAGTAGGRGGG
jgi:hypothetical protein